MLKYDFNYTTLSQKIAELYTSMGSRSMMHLVRDVATEATEYEMNIARGILDSETRQSGRLAASLGKYDREWLREPNPESGPSDAYWEEYFADDEVYIIAGSRVEYAAAINYGFEQTDTRKVYLQRESRWVTVKPFTYGGLHFMERAADQVASDKEKIDNIVIRNLRKRVVGWEVK